MSEKKSTKSAKKSIKDPMKRKFLLLAYFLIIASCSTQSEKAHKEGEIISSLDSRTYHAQYMGKDLKIGDKVKIVEYDFNYNLKNRQSKNLPMPQKKKVIGEAVVSSILNDHFYELKSDKPQHIPAEAFIEKL
ncbi:MAG: hypothetical protein ACXVLQ_10095 [Bacteriovorax sp.]